jgi:parkin
MSQLAKHSVHDWSCCSQECDLGQQSVLHAVKSRPSPRKLGLESPSEGSRPLNETLIDLQLSERERHTLKTDAGE